MPLNAVTLTNEILKLTDASRPDFVGFPLTPEVVAANWANAAKVFFLEMVVPPVLPAVVAAGAEAFRTAMATALGPSGSLTGLTALSAGFGAMATVLAAGAVPPAATPPPLPVLAPLTAALAPFILVPVPDPTPSAVATAGAILTWCKTGLYGVAPAPPTTPWS